MSAYRKTPKCKTTLINLIEHWRLARDRGTNQRSCFFAGWETEYLLVLLGDVFGLLGKYSFFGKGLQGMD